ncbi:threonine--tRNA ligase, mitochondrial 1 [Arachis hypogaea]|uniref:threonine--tRNA ligase, mitochondrial 1 n=1 Tax=Arachis hypogaea TaxID=3818 RepID=UPI000DECF46C|nr:threonine--tRNA ligase, mitochondrial 1 isoform X2 [Arachis hypogaea]QHO45685.1 Threonine--tRNA ligase [Arachis hypogaea]
MLRRYAIHNLRRNGFVYSTVTAMVPHPKDDDYRDAAIPKLIRMFESRRFFYSTVTAMVPHPKDDYLNAAIPKRIKMFESIQAEQKTQRLSLSPDPIKVTLPDGTVKDAAKWQTTPFDVAKEISKNLANNALIARVNGVLWDMARPLEQDCELRIYKFEDDEGRDTFWHSSALILGQSLEMEYGCKLCVGLCTTRREGFYYDAFYGDLGLNDDHFKQIEARALKAVGEKQPFERIEVTRDQALEMFSDNEFKVEIINDLPADKTITVYRCGSLVDLSRGPHIPNNSFVKAIACLKASSAYWRGNKARPTCLKASSAYWRGNKARPTLQRVYGISYPDQESLKEYLLKLEEAKKYDYRNFGVEQELLSHHESSPRGWFFLPRGALVYEELMNFISSQYEVRGYEEVITPHLFEMDLWVRSSLAANYKEIKKHKFGLKAIWRCSVFKHRARSYSELPLRMAEFGGRYRNEASDDLSELKHRRIFEKDDAHIFCRESQIKDEVREALKFIDYVYEIFGFTYDLKLSTKRPENSFGETATWEKAESALKEALDEFGKPWQLNEGDGALYGPKIDIKVSDALSRKFQCATLQLNFQLPNCFKLEYLAEDEAKIERPVMIHMAILGSVKRLFNILLGHYKGKWPFWLSPRQAIVCPVSKKSQAYAKKVKDEIYSKGFLVDADLRYRKIEKKVREAQLAQYNYILVVGEQEAETGQVSVRDKVDLTTMSIEGLLERFSEDAKNFR